MGEYKLSKKGILFIVIIASLLISGCDVFSNTKEVNEDFKEDYTPVKVSKVKIDTLYNITSYTGKITANKDIFVIPKIIGKVSKLNVRLGDKVNKGNLLFTLDQNEIKKQVKNAEAQLNNSKKSYESILDNVELVDRGEAEPFEDKFENLLTGWSITYIVDVPNTIQNC